MGAFTLVHVVLSLVGIFSGFVAVFGMLAAKRLPAWTALFLVTTVATSLTGFLLPAPHFLPSHAIGILSLIVLAVATVALYSRRLAGPWRLAYVINAMLALSFNVFVGVAQGIVLVLFLALGIAAATRFRPVSAASL
ncbi:MAG: hypothetical protein PHC88_08275 [Terrimicrobiaceae bacterium]|nr:hypothetical protein [Terrimicrobiaceae bacterium]